MSQYSEQLLRAATAGPDPRITRQDSTTKKTSMGSDSSSDSMSVSSSDAEKDTLTQEIFQKILSERIELWMEQEDELEDDIEIFVSEEQVTKEFLRCERDYSSRLPFGLTNLFASKNDAEWHPQVEETPVTQFTVSWVSKHFARIKKEIIIASQERHTRQVRYQQMIQAMRQRQMTIDNWREIVQFLPHDSLQNLHHLKNVAQTCRIAALAMKSIHLRITGAHDSESVIALKCMLFTVDTLTQTSCEQASHVIQYGRPEEVRNVSFWMRGTAEYSDYYDLISHFPNLKHLGPCFNALKLLSRRKLPPNPEPLPSVETVFISYSDDKYGTNSLDFWSDLLMTSQDTLKKVRVHYPCPELMNILLKRANLKNLFLIPRGNRLEPHLVKQLLTFSSMECLTLKSCQIDMYSTVRECIIPLGGFKKLRELNVSLASSMCKCIPEPFLDQNDVKILGLYRIYFPLPASLESVTVYIPRSTVDWDICFRVIPPNLTKLTVVIDSDSLQKPFFEYLSQSAQRFHRLRTLIFISEVSIDPYGWNVPLRSVQNVVLKAHSVYESTLRIQRSHLFSILHLVPKAQLVIHRDMFDLTASQDELLYNTTNELKDNSSLCSKFLSSCGSRWMWRQNLTQLYNTAEKEYFPHPVKTMCEVELYNKSPQARVHPQYWLPLSEFDGLPEIILD